MYWLMVILNTNIYYKSVTKVLLNNSIRKSFKINDQKPVLLYAPIGLASAQQLPLSDALFKAYHVVVQGVDETMLPEEALVAPKYLSAQDLILMSDVVITDYSNIIFDAMAIDKTVALYTPNHSQYIEFSRC